MTNQRKGSLLRKVNIEAQPLRNCRNRCNARLYCGTVTIVCGLILLSTKTIFIEYITTSSFILTPDSKLTNMWAKSPFPLPVEIFFFNWTNPEEFYDASVKPKFQEVGPYRYTETIEKVNLTWHRNNTVTFRQLKLFHYDNQMPNGNISEDVTTLNFITSVFADLAKDWNFIIKKSVSIIINSVSPDIHLTRPVKQIVSEGLDDLLIRLGNVFPFILQHIPRFEKVGIISVRNNSLDFDGVFNTETGANGEFNLKRWNYNSKSPYFNSTCNKVQGSLGEFFGRNRTKDSISLFVPEICRFITLDYQKEVTVKGILGYKYVLGRSIFDNGTTVPENKCFCYGECIPSGMLSIQSCRYGVPAFLSLPHYYQADPVYMEAVEGLNPEELKHEGYIVVEPVTGIPISVSIGIQLNFLVHPVEGIEAYEDVRSIYFPVCWVKQTASIPDGFAILLRIYLYLPWIIPCISVVLMLLGLYFALRNSQTNRVISYCIPAKKTVKQEKEIPERSLLLVTKETD